MARGQGSPPVLLVHGIWDSSARLEPLRLGLLRRGVVSARAVDLVPNDGRAAIPELAAQVAAAAARLADEHGARCIDLVGFSMGALVSRWFLQRGGGRDVVRRFVSIAGPHAGTVNAFARPHAGYRDMRPGSALLRELAADRNPWGDVEVHCVYTPYDLMIVPSVSAVLPGARSVTRVPVKLHRWLITDARAVDAVAVRLNAA